MSEQVFSGINAITELPFSEVSPPPLTHQQETVALKCCEITIILGTHKSEETCPHCGTIWRYESRVYGMRHAN